MTFAALYSEHDEKPVAEVRNVQISVEVSRFTDGMLAAIDDTLWDSGIPTQPTEVEALLRKVPRSIDLSEYKKSRHGPKQHKASPKRTRPKTHISTTKVLTATKRRP